MATSKQKKIETLEVLEKLFATSGMTVLSHYRGLSVREISLLRKQLAEKDGSLKIVKNSLLRRYLTSQGASEELLELCNGPISITLGKDIEICKTLNDFSKANETFVNIGGVDSDSTVYSSDQIKALANLPTKDQLIGQLASVLNAPISNFASVLRGNLVGLTRVLQARAEKL